MQGLIARECKISCSLVDIRGCIQYRPRPLRTPETGDAVSSSGDGAKNGIDASREQLVKRKDHHLDLCLHADVGSRGPAIGLGALTLEYDALPEVDLDEVDLSITLLGKKLLAPIVIGAMTGGTERAGTINRRLARAAAKVGVGMALGSQRAMIVRPELAPTFAARDAAPELRLLIANVGAVQLNYGVGAPEIARAIRDVGADAINFHLNPLQEAIQPEGDTRFRGLSAKLAAVIPELGVPALAKEVGSGISERTAKKLAALPFAGIEVAGVGGTSWARVESHRAPPASIQAEIGQRLAGFGVPTASSIAICRKVLGDEKVVIASGGIRHGMDVAVSLALGADAAALAQPLLAAADTSEDAAIHELEKLVHVLRVIAFCCGARNVEELRRVRVIGVGGGRVAIETGEKDER
jgi:isopentenyl-diphosphate delta-isomerase